MSPQRNHMPAQWMTMTFTLISIAFLFAGCKKNSGSDSGPLPKVSIQDITAIEGNNGQTSFEFGVSLDHAASTAVEVTYSTAEGTAKGGEDFVVQTNQVITLQPGELIKKIAVNVVADDIREGDETFTVVLSGATHAILDKSSAAGLILNDDTKIPLSNAGYDAPSSYTGYTLAWSDEFNNTTLDGTAWSSQNGDGCPSLCGWGNNELEYYTDRGENLFFQDGKLVIEARKENYGGKSYTSSKILTSGKKPFKYGRIDIRAKLPKGKGIWPALWLLPQNNVYGGWPRSGEIDLMEMIGHEANRVYATLHFGPGPGSTQIGRNYTLPSGNFNDEFHVFSLEWKLDQIKWLVDGQVYSTVNKADLGANTYPFNESFYLIFNLAVGGNWPGSPDTSTIFPQWLVVDYVRVYQ
jgi:beta-glucanase (GH16 family)